MKKSLFVAALSFCTLFLSAQFSGAYAPINWQVIHNNSNGSVNTSGAPGSIAINGSNNGSNNAGRISYRITIPSSGTLSFNYNVTQIDNDGAGFDNFGYRKNGADNFITDDLQTGSATFSVNAGDVFDFYVSTTDNTTGGLNVPISNFSTVILLPLRFLSFTGNKQGEKVALQWQTSHELNASHFEIEHSTDAVIYAVIGSVKNSGNNNASINSYNYIHSLPFSGKNLYRIKQIDTDRKFAYSKIVSINLETETALLVSYNESSGVYSINCHNQTVLTIDVFNTNGNLVKRQLYNSGIAILNANQLPQGVYVLKVTTNSNTYSRKILKN